MKKVYVIAIAAAAAGLSSCTTSRAPALYNWYDYTGATYNYVKAGDEASLENLMAVYQQIVDGQTGTIRETVPPGVCADYGYMLVEAGRTEEGVELLRKEAELYPESAPFVRGFLAKIGYELEADEYVADDAVVVETDDAEAASSDEVNGAEDESEDVSESE